jgi:hypothetical protein
MTKAVGDFSAAREAATHKDYLEDGFWRPVHMAGPKGDIATQV